MVKAVYSGIRKAVENHCPWYFTHIVLQDTLDSPTIVVITDRNDLRWSALRSVRKVQ